MKNGFTLIELLAVIVILAIIALIATPIVLGLIDDAKRSANERSIDMYADSVQNAIMGKQIGNKVSAGNYETQDGRILTLKTNPSEKIEVEYDGADVVCEEIQIKKDGTFFLGNCKIGSQLVDYTYGTLFFSSINSKPLDASLKSNSLKHNNIWKEITYTPFTIFHGGHVWTDGKNTYYSNTVASYGEIGNYVLNGTTWETKTWSGLSAIDGLHVWGYDGKVYYSKNTVYGESTFGNYELNKETSTWSPKTWNGLTAIDGQNVWTDGTNIYYSLGTIHYILNKETSTWSPKTWNGLTNFTGYNIWTDGLDIYYSTSTESYILDKETNTWTKKEFKGLESIDSSQLWTDGSNVYHSVSSKSSKTYTHYILKGDTWESIEFKENNLISGSTVWSDGKNIYCTYKGYNYELK